MKMKSLLTLTIALSAFTMTCLINATVGQAHMMSGASDIPRYDAAGRLILPADYREWVFLSSGLDMNYSDSPAAQGRHIFGNVFAPRAAYLAFKKDGIWPDKTILMLEDRTGSTMGSINKTGQFQTEVTGMEAHVKDVARFKGGWGFFAFDDSMPADLIDYDASCYSCHLDHAAVDTTFVQFYPTLLPVAKKLKTLSPSYQAETAREVLP
jgi:hypothetical protein